MVREVLRGSTKLHRQRGAKELIWGLALTTVGLAGVIAALSGAGGLLGSTADMLVMPLGGVLVFYGLARTFSSGWRFRDRSTKRTLEIDRESLSWSDGKRSEQIVARKNVADVQWIGKGHEPYLSFADAAGQPVAAISAAGFDKRQVETSLARHWWPRVQSGIARSAPLASVGPSRATRPSGGTSVIVLHGSTTDHRIVAGSSLAIGLFFVYLGLWPFGFVAGDQAASSWRLQATVFCLAVPFFAFAIYRFSRPTPGPSISVSRSEVSWSDGRRQTRTVPRAHVFAARQQVFRNRLYMNFLDITGESVLAIPTGQFSQDDLAQALGRRGWPVLVG